MYETLLVLFIFKQSSIVWFQFSIVAGGDMMLETSCAVSPWFASSLLAFVSNPATLLSLCVNIPYRNGSLTIMLPASCVVMATWSGLTAIYSLFFFLINTTSQCVFIYIFFQENIQNLFNLYVCLRRMHLTPKTGRFNDRSMSFSARRRAFPPWVSWVMRSCLR